MIVKISFKATVKKGSKKSSAKDYVKVHCASEKMAKEIFNDWLLTSRGVRGASGIYHPLFHEFKSPDDYGKISIRSVKEIK